MIFEQIFEPNSSTYSYVIASGVGREALIIDPVFEDVDRYLRLMERLDLKLVKAIDTHIHADHVTGLGALRDVTRCVTVMGEASGAEVVSMRVKEGEAIDIDGVSLRTLFTPGHTDDSYSFVMDDRVFTGDALLIHGTGRTDFQNGDPYAAYDSLFNKLLKLSDRTLVYPAHDYRGNTVSTIGNERRHNPRLQVNSAAEYAEIMNNLNLPNPKMMDVAVPANRSLGGDLTAKVAPGEELAPEAARAHHQELLLVDLREPGERSRDGYIAGSEHLPYKEALEQLNEGGRLSEMIAQEGERVVLYCAFGERSALTLEAAREAGAAGARHLAGGMAAWLRSGGDVIR